MVKIIIRSMDNQQTPWMVGIKWPDGRETLLYGRYMGTWREALEDALSLVEQLSFPQVFHSSVPRPS